MKRAFVSFLSLIAVSCTQTEQSVSDELDRADALIFVDPDSAQVVLDGVGPHGLRSNESMVKYGLLRTIIDDRLGNVHRSLDGILPALDYFSRFGASDSLLAIVHLYVGRVYEDLGEHERALEEYLVAQSHSGETENNNYWKGRIAYNIGYLYHHDRDFAHASDFLEDAISHFGESGNALDAAHSYHLFGFNHYILKNYDISLDAFDKSDKIYRDLDHTDGILSNVLPRSGVYLDLLGDIQAAESVMTEAHDEFHDGVVPLSHLPHMSRIESAKGNHLRAVELLEEYLGRSPDLPLSKQKTIHYLISTYLDEAGLHSEAYRNLDRFVALSDSLHAYEVNSILQEVEKKYEKQTLENEYRLYRKISLYRILAGSIGLLAIISVLIIHIRKRRQKYLDLEIDLDRLKSQMNEFDDLNNRLSALLSESTEKEAKLQNVLTRRMLRLQKIVDFLHLYENRPDEFQRKISAAIVIAEKDEYFGELHDVVNEKYAGIVDYLKREYPTLTDEELNLCCLICFGFNNSQIGILFGYTNPNSVFNKRHKLRKKMGLWPNYDSLEAYLAKIVSELRVSL